MTVPPVDYEDNETDDGKFWLMVQKKLSQARVPSGV